LEAHRVERKLAAIFAADVEGYSRLMGRDEVGTLRTLTAYRTIIDHLIASHRGRIFNTADDSLVADFASAVDAAQCAVEVQDAIRKENADRYCGGPGRIASQILANRIIRRRSAPSHTALLGDVGPGRIIQAIDLVHLWKYRGSIALSSQRGIQPGSVYSQRI
jgi:class 3 adenylate cyclase